MTSGQTNDTVDAGLYENAALGDLVWLDANANGIQDTGETTGVAGVTVTLYNATGTQVGTPVVTPVSGAYSFSGLTPGQYKVCFTTPPAGYNFSPTGQGTPSTDSDAGVTTGGCSALTTLTSGQDDTTVDAGLVPLAGISGQVREDLNANGVPSDPDPSISGVTVTLWTDPNGDGDPSDGVLVKSTTTDGQGNYSFTNVSPGTYVVVETDPDGFLSSWDKVDPNNNRIPVTLSPGGDSSTGNDFLDYKLAALGDFVWVDANANGIQDNGEVGLDNVTVELHKIGTTGAFATVTTSGGGLYSFPNLLPDSYYVHFVLPAGYLHSPANQGSNDQVDSDANIATGDTPVTTLVSGQTNNSLDGGMIPAATLGDKAWVDTNGDGIQDTGEPGLPGVTVNVYRTSDNSLAGTDTTDGSGIWSVPDLAPGSYYVQFTPPAGYNFTLSNQGANDQVDSDPDPATGRTAPLTLVSGQVDNSVDAGLIAPAPSYTITKTRITAASTRKGARVEFKIHIANTGNLPITFLPLVDEYDKSYLTYGYGSDFSTPTSDDNVNDGTISWHDLTAAAPDGFGHSLGPGTAFDITIVFTAAGRHNRTAERRNHQHRTRLWRHL